MNRNQAKEFYLILQAFVKGKTIECRTKPSLIEGKDVPNDWTEMKEIDFWRNTEYRIKPESKYRPFKDAEECWTEMEKYSPFGWVKNCDGSKSTIEIVDSSNNSIYVSDEGTCFLGEMFEEFKFADGQPFGIKVEE